jgi:hypothetical protein
MGIIKGFDVFDNDPRLSAHSRALQPAAPINRDQERVFRFADGIGGDHTASCSLTPTFPAPLIGKSFCTRPTTSWHEVHRAWR